ncbi:phosphotransferase [Pontibacillus sp. HMF3514]|uniref:phosphotransferase n=1 Tax=Pontibacillus sp. HMF3514 TaxID=2692425 RepID=UPI0013200CFA|nr:phosphotransferase [Pontibacillus sp. HMF3514]QHE53158.1 phosphotransferase [Pontibacillus sp. HMF3514]
MKDVLKEVLAYYGLSMLDYEAYTSRVYKVRTHYGDVAVKHSRLTDETVYNWLEVYEQAKNHRIQSFIPLYMTSEKQLFVRNKTGIYYAMPWIDTPHRDTPPYPFEALYSTMGEIHRRTSHTETVKREDFEPFIEHQKMQLEGWRERLEDAVTQFEKRHYMPPFELQICTHFRNVMYAFQKSAEWCDRFLDDIEEDKTFRHALSHNQLKPTHFLYDDNQPYVLNWERASINHPMHDLTTYFWQVMRYHDAPIEQITSTFSSYEDQFSLKNSERSLLAIYLLQPDHYMEQIERYVNGAREDGQPFRVQKLERSYFVLNNALQIEEQLEQTRTYIQQEQEES